MEKFANMVPTKIMPACGWLVVILGSLQMILFGSWVIGGIQTFTGLYILTIAVTMKMGSTVKQYATWLSIMTVIMFINMIVLIIMGEYFGALSTAFLIAGGIATLCRYYLDKDEEDQK